MVLKIREMIGEYFWVVGLGLIVAGIGIIVNNGIAILSWGLIIAAIGVLIKDKYDKKEN